MIAIISLAFWAYKALSFEQDKIDRLYNDFSNITPYSSHDKTIEICESLLELEPGHTGARMQLGRVYFENQEYEKALDQFREVVRIDPNHEIGYFKMGQTLDNLNKKDEAIVAYYNASRLDRKNEKFLNYFGIACAEQGKIEPAYVSFMRAWAAAPNNPKPCLNLAHMYHGRGKYKRALFFYKEALKIEPKIAFIYNNLEKSFSFLQIMTRPTILF